MIYGNCQHTHLQNFLEQTDFINYFNLVKVKDVYLKDKSYLDDDTLSKIDLFIYQHVSPAFDPFFCTDHICSKLRPDCIRISIPNFWLSAYFPQHAKNPVIRPNRKYSIAPSGLFPYGDNNINSLLSANVRTENIIKIVSDPDFYDEKTITDNLTKTLNDLNQRENLNKVDIPSVPYLKNAIYSNYMSVTVNHPTNDYFLWLTNSILDCLGINKKRNIDIYPFSKNHIHVPLYPSVIKHLNLNFIKADHCYSFYNESINFEEYVKRYIDHATGYDIYGKDSIGIEKINKISTGDIKLLQCSKSESKIKELYSLFHKYKDFKVNKNTIIYGNKIEYASDGTYQSVPGLMLKFSGVNNMVVIEDGATFKDSTILLNSGGYVHLGNSKYNNLSILNNNIGGKVFIGNSCIIDKQLDIYLNGDNCCKIGDGCVIGSDVNICCQDEHSLLDSNGYLLNPGQPINIGDRVWIGPRVMLLKGTHISDECYVSAGCIVENKFFTSNQVISGAPANTISSGVTWAMSSPENYRCK